MFLTFHGNKRGKKYLQIPNGCSFAVVAVSQHALDLSKSTVSLNRLNDLEQAHVHTVIKCIAGKIACQGLVKLEQFLTLLKVTKSPHVIHWHQCRKRKKRNDPVLTEILRAMIVSERLSHLEGKAVMSVQLQRHPHVNK